MSGHIPPPIYPRNDGYDPSQPHGQAQLAPEGGIMEPEALLRQRLAPEIAPELALQQWHDSQQYHPVSQQQHQHQHQQVMPPPPAPPVLQRPPQSVMQYTAAAPAPPPPPPQAQIPQAQVTPAQSPPSEAPTPKSTAAGRATRLTKAKATPRGGTGRRRKVSVSKDESDGSLSEEEFTMEGVKTKSGRKVHRPAHFNPAQKTPSRRRGPYRRNHDARICRVCQRGHSPQSNMIVFCDGCNGPFHQLCHDPPIDDLVIQVESAEWFCSACAKLREQKPLQFGLTGAALTDEEKRLYLASLPMSSLVEIIFFAEKTHPDLPLYDPNTKEIAANLKNGPLIKQDDATPGAAEDNTVDVVDGSGPNWEDMIVRAINALDTGKGVQPKYIFEWISTNFPALEARDVRAEATGPLQTALRKERLTREGHFYRINQGYMPAPPKTQLAPGLLAPGAGIKLPLETEIEGAADMLVDDDMIAFSHWYQPQQQQQQQQQQPQAIVDDMMEGIVRNGYHHHPHQQQQVVAQ